MKFIKLYGNGSFRFENMVLFLIELFFLMCRKTAHLYIKKKREIQN
jgi:hypothetical protein